MLRFIDSIVNFAKDFEASSLCFFYFRFWVFSGQIETLWFWLLRDSGTVSIFLVTYKNPHLNRDTIESNLSVPGIQGYHENALYKSFETSPISWCPWITGTLKLDSISSLFKCVPTKTQTRRIMSVAKMWSDTGVTSHKILNVFKQTQRNLKRCFQWALKWNRREVTELRFLLR